MTYRFSIHEIAIFGRFWALTPSIWSNIAEILTRGSTLVNKNTVWKFSERLNIYGKGTDPKLALLVQLWHIFSSWRWPKSKKISSSAGKRLPLSSPNMSKWSLYLNIYIYKYIHIHIHTYIHNTGLVFSIFGISTKKQGGVTGQRGKIKIWQMLFHPHR